MRRAALRKEGAPMICLLSSTPHPTSLRSATFPSRGRLEERANQRLPLEGKLSAARLTDEVAGGLPCCFAPHNNSVLLRKIVVEPGYNHLKGYEIGVTIAVTPILSLGFCGAKSDARYNCGQGSSCANLMSEASLQTGILSNYLILIKLIFL